MSRDIAEAVSQESPHTVAVGFYGIHYLCIFPMETTWIEFKDKNKTCFCLEKWICEVFFR